VGQDTPMTPLHISMELMCVQIV